MAHRRGCHHLRRHSLQKPWKNQRRDCTHADGQNSKVENTKDIPGDERFARGKAGISGERKGDPWRSDTDRHVAKASGPSEVTGQKSEQVQSDESNARETPRLRCGEQRHISGQYEVAEGARGPISNEKDGDWNDDRGQQSQRRRPRAIDENSTGPERET